MQNKEVHNKNHKTLRLNIKGMSCNSCSSNIQRALNKQDYIIQAEVFLLTHSATIIFNNTQTTQEQILQLIYDLGYEATIQEKTNLFTPTQPNLQTNFIKPNSTFQKPILVNATQNFIPQNKISFSTNDTKQSSDTNTISQDIQTNTTHQNQRKQNIKSPLIHAFLFIHNFIENTLLNTKRRMFLSILFTIAILYISMGAMLGLSLPESLQNNTTNALLQLFITLCVMHFGRSFYIRGIKALFKLYPNMDSLIALGSLAGFFYSFFTLLIGLITNNPNLLTSLYFESVCTILCFIMIGKFIEENAKNKAMQNAQTLLAKKEDIAYKIIDLDKQTIKEVESDSLQKGDYIKITSYSHIPADGILYSQQASIDESMLSGESLPVIKHTNDPLYAGTLNLNESCIMQVQASPKDSTLAKIHALLLQAYESKAKIAKLADKISSIFVPIVLLLAISSFCYWLFVSNFQQALIFFASTLLISCPCALGLATPMSILFANARANKMGIFFKNAQSLEQISKCNYALFDKTGTLTQKDFSLQEIELYTQEFQNKDELLQIVASIEKTSNHIIAQSICKLAQHLPHFAIVNAQTSINQGIKATLQRHNQEETFIVGSKKFMHSYIKAEQFSQSIHTQEPSNHTHDGLHIYIAKFQENTNTYILIGKIILQETLKDEAKTLIQTLQKQGITCEILSGDHEDNVKKIANELNITYQSACTPQDKLHKVELLQSQNHKVVMIGDGVNDAIAIAQADVSIVMASGSSISIEHGDIIYFSKNLANLSHIFTLGKITLKNIKQNLTFAFLYNIICIPIAMGVFSGIGIILNPMFASFAMCLSSLSVVTNSIRLYKIDLMTNK